jgi:hypothetical protein
LARARPGTEARRAGTPSWSSGVAVSVRCLVNTAVGVFPVKGGVPASFTAKPFNSFIAGDKLVQKNLDRHFVADVFATRAVNRSHAALSHSSDEFVFGIENLACQHVIRDGA